VGQNKLDNTFYPFNNAIRTLPNTPEGFDAPTAYIKALGYDGLGGHQEKIYYELRKAMDKVGLEMPEMYIKMELDEKGNIVYDKRLKDILKDSKDRNLLVTLHLHSKKYLNNKKEGDKLFTKGIQELADFCKPLNIKIAIYPHVDLYCERVDHSITLCRMADRDNVGVVFNLCHYFKVEGDKGWEEQILRALPHLSMVGISGSDKGDTRNMGWDRLIQPLGEGSFDTYKLIKFLKDNNYNGRIGLQCYNIKQDFKVAMSKSINTWKEYKNRYENE
jgi:sugar phosphate isomerase/epimerase